ncbi:MAG: O-antigen ligase family protein [Daejeonella sp.]
MFIFPIIYLSLFVIAVSEILKGNKQAFLLFLIFGLPIYVTTLSLVYSTGFTDSMTFVQSTKEFIILLVFIICIWNLKVKVNLHLIDYLVIIFFFYTLMYVLLPIGEHDVINRMVAFKSTSFFGIVYSVGRLFNPREIYINKYFHYILLLTIAAGLVLLVEIITDQHLQHYTGYADYNVNFLNFEASGNEGLTFTFETENGFKRFASFFANPLEYAAATLLSLAVIAGLYTRDDHKFIPDGFGRTALVFTIVAIIFTISRAAFVSYFFMIYMYALRTNKKIIIYGVNAAILAAILFIFFVTKNEDMVRFVMNTIKFTDSSSVGHLLDWLEGIAAISEEPLGMGLGASGRIAVTLGTNTGGHNQFLIVGVQTGIIAMGLYIAIYIGLVTTTWRWLYRLKGKAKKVCITLLLIKIGMFIPLFTSEIETSAYISYITWFLSGLFISIIAHEKKVSESAKQKNISI